MRDNWCQKWNDWIGLIELLDSMLHCIVIVLYYENGTNDGTAAGQNTNQLRRNESHDGGLSRKAGSQ
jgi:hypothetical protein